VVGRSACASGRWPATVADASAGQALAFRARFPPACMPSQRPPCVQVAPLMAARQEAAQQLLASTEAYLCHQSLVWQRQTDLLGGWLAKLARCYEDGRAAAARQDAGMQCWTPVSCFRL